MSNLEWLKVLYKALFHQAPIRICRHYFVHHLEGVFIKIFTYALLQNARMTFYDVTTFCYFCQNYFSDLFFCYEYQMSNLELLKVLYKALFHQASIGICRSYFVHHLAGVFIMIFTYDLLQNARMMFYDVTTFRYFW